MTNASNTNEYNSDVLETQAARGFETEEVTRGQYTRIDTAAQQRNELRRQFLDNQEDRIASQFGPQFTLESIEEYQNDLFTVLNANRQAYAEEILNPNISAPDSERLGSRNMPTTSPSSRRVALPIVPTVGTALTGLQVALARIDEVSPEELRNKALNCHIWWNGFSQEERTNITLENEGLPPRPGTASVDVGEKLRLAIPAAQNNVPEPSTIRQELIRKMESILSRADLNMGPVAEARFGETIRYDTPSMTEFFFGSTAQTAALSSARTADFLVRNFYWFYYNIYQNRRYAQPINLDAPPQVGPYPRQTGETFDIFGGAGLNLEDFLALYAMIKGRELALQVDNELIEQSVRSDDPGIVESDGVERAAYSNQAVAYAEDRLLQLASDNDGDDITPEQLAQLKRLAEQAFLIDYLPEFAKLNQDERTPLYAEKNTGRRYFTMVHGHTDTIVNKLLYNGSVQDLESLLPAEISALVPQIRLYKVFYDIQENGQRGQTYEQEIPFEAHVDPRTIDAGTEGIRNMTTPGIQRGRGAGITSFDWKLEGQNPFTARRDIYAELKLYFQSMEDFIRRVDLPTIRGDARPFSYIDLVNIGLVERTTALAWNPDYFKLKVECGWFPPGLEAFLGSDADKAAKQAAVNASRMCMYLTAIDHNIEINEFGNVNLTIEYIAWQEGSYFDADSDVLADRNALTARLLRRKNLLEAASTCNEDYIAALKREYQLKIRDEKYNSWQRIMKELYQNDRIFYAPVNTSTLRSYINFGRTNFRGIEVLLRRSSEPLAINNLNLASRSGEADIEAHVGVSAPTDGQEEDTVLKRLTGLTYDDSTVETAVQFFYFGDLMEIALNNISETLDNAPPGTDIKGKLDKQMRFIMGPISFKKLESNADEPVPSTGQQIERLRRGLEPLAQPTSYSSIVYNINIADIPISVNYFVEWFINQALSKEKSFYPFLAFARDLASKLLHSVMSEQGQSFHNIARQNLQLRTLFFSGKAGRESDGAPRDLLEEYFNVLPTTSGEQCCGPSGEGTNTRIDLDEAFNQNRNRRGGAPLLIRPDRGDESFHYMLMYAITTEAAQNLSGDQAEDEDRGIYHLAIAQDRGILKKVDFTKANFEGLREARFETDLIGSATGLSILANVYDIKVNMVGNTAFYPGMKMYLDPAGLGGEIGSPTRRGSPAFKLGIGGYHTIYRVESYIESGKFETKIHAIFEGVGGPAALGFNSPNETVEVETDDSNGPGPSSVGRPDSDQCSEATRAIDLLFGRPRATTEF